MQVEITNRPIELDTQGVQFEFLRVDDFPGDGIGDLKCCSPEVIFSASTSQFVGVIVGEYDAI